MAIQLRKKNGASAPKSKATDTTAARKRKAPKKVELAGPVWKDNELYLSPYDLARYELAQTRAQNAAQALKLKRHEIDQEHQRHKEALQEQARHVLTLEAAHREHLQELKALQVELEAQYPVPFNEITYDTITGRINRVPAGTPIRKGEVNGRA